MRLLVDKAFKYLFDHIDRAAPNVLCWCVVCVYIHLLTMADASKFPETDHTFPAESRRRAEDILAEVKAVYYVQLFSGVSHGFATRGDPDVEISRAFYITIFLNPAINEVHYRLGKGTIGKQHYQLVQAVFRWCVISNRPEPRNYLQIKSLDECQEITPCVQKSFL